MNTNTALVNEYLAYLQTVLHRSPATLHTYHGGLRRLLAAIDKPFALVTVQDLHAFCARVRTRGGPLAADATVARDVAMLRAFWRWLHEIAEAVPRNVGAKLVAPTVHNEDPHPVPVDVWKRLWFANLPDGERVAYGLAYFCGLRRAEVTSLRPDQFTDIPAPLITSVLRKGGKRTGGFRWRSCIDLYAARLPDLLGDPDLFVAALDRLREERAHSLALLPWADERVRAPTVNPQPAGFVTPDRFNKRLLRRTIRLGLPPVSPHDLRHSFCTNLCSPRAGVPVEVVSRLAGHADVRVTMRYVDVGRDPLAELLAVDAKGGELVEVSRWGC